MSSDHQDTPRPPTELHRQPPSSAITFPTFFPQTPSPPPTTSSTTTPESRLAAALGHAFLNIPPSSFQTTTTNNPNPLIRTLSDADSSANQTPITTITPPKIPRTTNNNNTPLRRTVSDSITRTKNPLRRTLSDTTEYQQPLKTPRVSSSPQSSTGKQSPKSEVILKKVEDMVREIEQRCLEIMREEVEEEEEHVEEEIHQPQPQEKEECVGVERLKNGDLRFELSCSCGKRFEMLIKHNGYCFYRLT
ncbi:uncharacterized protein LOC143600594 [Bidens hawaiensis]|uniref:uncharacterized protein LOC143600594 n=1 Tax=Bidens hawaiensis TaxID=980011 RepID=UPI0040498E43